MKDHAEQGALLLSPLGYPASYVRAARYHHVRFDGTGYPAGAGRPQVDRDTRILMVTDPFDAMIDPYRPYQQPMDVESAIGRIDLFFQQGKFDDRLYLPFQMMMRSGIYARMREQQLTPLQWAQILQQRGRELGQEYGFFSYETLQTIREAEATLMVLNERAVGQMQ